MKTKKILSLCLTLAMILSAMTVAVMPAAAADVTYEYADLTYISGNVDGTEISEKPDGTTGFAGIANPAAKQYTPAEFTFSFDVANAGTFTMDYNYRWHQTGRLWEIRIDGVRFGRIDTSIDFESSGNAKFWTKTIYNSDDGKLTGDPAQVALTAGTHEITFACVGVGANSTSSGERFVCKYIVLKEVSAFADSVYTMPTLPAHTTENIDLPATVADTANDNKALPIVWTSSDESVISSSGAVAVADTTKSAVLTATVTDANRNEKVHKYGILVPGTADEGMAIGLLDRISFISMLESGNMAFSGITGSNPAPYAYTSLNWFSSNPYEGTEYSPINTHFARVDSDAVGASVTVAVIADKAGVYNLKYTYRQHGHDGQFQVSVNGTDIEGTLVDAGDDKNAVALGELGNIALNEGINYVTFKVVAAGKGGRFGMDLIDLFLAKTVFDPADYSAVDAAKAAVPADLTVYTDETAGAVTDAVSAVEEELDERYQDTVDGYAEAINAAVSALELKAEVAESLKINIGISDGVALLNDTNGKYDITWNADVTLGSEASLEDINAKVDFKSYGVIYGTSADAVQALANGEDTNQAKRLAFKEADEENTDINIYTIFGFRLKSVSENRTRAAMFYITYEFNGIYYTVYSDCVDAVAAS